MAAAAFTIPAVERGPDVLVRRVVDRERCARVEHHGVPDRAGLAAEESAYDVGVVGRVASAQVLGRRARDAERGGIDGELGDLSPVDAPHGRGGRRGELVEAVVAAEHPGVDAALGQDARHHRRHPLVGAPDGLSLRTGRVGERTEDVERRRDAELTPRDGGVAHRGVERGGEAEGDARLLRDLRHAGRRQVEADAERLEDVGRAGLGGRGPVAVLDDARARAGRDDRRHGRDVHRHGPVATRADDVEQPARHRDRVGRGEHRRGKAGDLVDGLALGAQRDHERGDLDRRRRPGEQLAGGPSCLLRRQVATGDQRGEDVGPGVGHGGECSRSDVRRIGSAGSRYASRPSLGCSTGWVRVRRWRAPTGASGR